MCSSSRLMGSVLMRSTADHGGHGFDHGSDEASDVTIPWIAWGRGVRAGQLTDSTVRTMDTASTVLWLLGLEEPSDWPGTPVPEAFASATGPVARAGGHVHPDGVATHDARIGLGARGNGSDSHHGGRRVPDGR